MNLYLKVFLISIVLLVSQHLVRLILILDLNTSGHVWNHAPGPCRLVKGVEHGSEHMFVSPEGLAFITSGLKLPTASETLKEYYRNNNVLGKILLFDFNHPENDVTELNIVGDGVNTSEFNPHGIDGLVDSKTGRVLLYVVNHAPNYEAIEKFEFIPEKKELWHARSFQNSIMRAMNDVALLDEDKFYFSQSNYYRDQPYNTLESLLMLPWGSVVYYNGETYEKALDGLLIANGIKLSHDKQLVYVANLGSRNIKIYKREHSNLLTLLNVIEVNRLLDNIMVIPETGHLLTGNHAVGYKVFACLNDPRQPCPSQVTMLYMKNDKKTLEKIVELYSDDGEASDSIHGSSVAAMYHK